MGARLEVGGLCSVDRARQSAVGVESSRKRGTSILTCNSVTTQVPFTEDGVDRAMERTVRVGRDQSREVNLDGGVYNRGLPSLTSRLSTSYSWSFIEVTLWNMAEPLPGHFGLRKMWHMMNGVVRESVVLP